METKKKKYDDDAKGEILRYYNDACMFFRYLRGYHWTERKQFMKKKKKKRTRKNIEQQYKNSSDSDKI